MGFDTTYTAQTSGGSIMDYLMTIGAACDLGFRVRLSGKNDQKKLLFEVYRPTADPNNRFSTKWGNLQQAAWAFGDSDYANVAVVQGAGEGENRATVTVGLTDATGADRRELYVDARDVQPDEEKGETTKSQAYLERLMARGTNKLLEQLRTGSIELTIDAEGLSPGMWPTAPSRSWATRPPSGWPMSSPKARATAPPAPCGWVRRSGASCKEMIF